jgi:hypothetical protein
VIKSAAVGTLVITAGVLAIPAAAETATAPTTVPILHDNLTTLTANASTQGWRRGTIQIRATLTRDQNGDTLVWDSGWITCTKATSCSVPTGLAPDSVGVWFLDVTSRGPVTAGVRQQKAGAEIPVRGVPFPPPPPGAR